MDHILEKALAGERITPAEALALYDSADFLEVMAAARELRNRRHNPAVVTYTMFRVVNYTTFCSVDCTFCSYADPLSSDRGQTLTRDQILEKMRESLAIGADQMLLQGGVNPNLPFDYYLDDLRSVKETFGPMIHIRAFSPVELLEMERLTGMPLRAVLRELKSAGMDSVPGAGAEILNERVRLVLSPQKAGVSEWVRVMETCHEEGLPGKKSSAINLWRVLLHLPWLESPRA